MADAPTLLLFARKGITRCGRPREAPIGRPEVATQVGFAVPRRCSAPPRDRSWRPGLRRWVHFPSLVCPARRAEPAGVTRTARWVFVRCVCPAGSLLLANLGPRVG